jgi:hypothetical protein
VLDDIKLEHFGDLFKGTRFEHTKHVNKRRKDTIHSEDIQKYLIVTNISNGDVMGNTHPVIHTTRKEHQKGRKVIK